MDTKSITQTSRVGKSRWGRLTLATVAIAMLLSTMGALAGGSSNRDGIAGAYDSVAEKTGLSADSASANARGCTWARSGSICIWVDGDSTTVDRIYTAYFKAYQICRPAAWIYAVYPSGRVRTLSYQSRTSCTWSTAWFSKTYSNYRYGGRYFPHGTRICVEIKEGGSPAGGEPCITIRR